MWPSTARSVLLGAWLLPAAAWRMGSMPMVRSGLGKPLCAYREAADEAASVVLPPASEDLESELSPGYGIPGRRASELHRCDARTRGVVRQNLAAVYGDLQDWDRVARNALASGLLLGVRSADDISSAFAAQTQVTASLEELETAAATATTTARVRPGAASLELQETTTTTTKRTVRRETQVRSKILRTGRRSVADRMEKVGDHVLPLWMSVAHSAEVRPLKTKLVHVGGVPIVLWRDASGRLSALSDVCMHRGASLARGWVAPSGCITCPYHGFEFDHSGALQRSPSVTGLAALSGEGGERISPTGVTPPSTVSYPVREEAGWIQLFPRSTREAFGPLHAEETVLEPLDYPELRDPRFRAVEGGCDIEGSIDAVMENVLDLLHISYVHLFGNGQEPLPIESEYFTSFDDPHPNRRLLKSGKVAFTYNAGSKAWSKVVGGQQVVTVENEFHLPYTMIIRVHFGASTKTIVASAVPQGPRKTRLNYKLYRDFALTHAKDEGPINKLLDRLFVFLMDLTLAEDKVIVESLYEHARQGYMNGKYDRHQLSYRRAVQDFIGAIAARDERMRLDAYSEVVAEDFPSSHDILQ